MPPNRFSGNPARGDTSSYPSLLARAYPAWSLCIGTIPRFKAHGVGRMIDQAPKKRTRLLSFEGIWGANTTSDQPLSVLLAAAREDSCAGLCRAMRTIEPLKIAGGEHHRRSPSSLATSSNTTPKAASMRPGTALDVRPPRARAACGARRHPHPGAISLSSSFWFGRRLIAAGRRRRGSCGAGSAWWS